MIIACALAAACAPVPPGAQSDAAVETVPLHVLARNMESYRGRTVRTCGTLSQTWDADGVTRKWQLRRIDPTSPYRFTAFVVVPACNGRPPPLANGCATGRVAREDGSLDQPTAITIGSHMIGSWEWWLHPQCEAERR